MKIGTPVSPGAAKVAPASAESASRTGQSFAEVLASGRSVADIRSERALGFSETGLLGAHRAFDTSSAPQAQGAAKALQTGSGGQTAAQLPAAQGATLRAETVVSMASQGAAPALTKAPAGQVDTPAHSTRSASGGEPSGPVRTGGLPASKAAMASASTFGATTLRPRANSVLRRSRSVALRDTDGAVDVHIFDLDHQAGEQDAIIENFLGTARDFDVTLGVIQLNGKPLFVQRKQESERL